MLFHIKNDKLWAFGEMDHIVRVDLETNRWYKIQYPKYLNDGKVSAYDVVPINEETLLIGTNFGLLKFNVYSEEFKLVPVIVNGNTIDNISIFDIYLDSPGKTYG